ncbi:hypothetical protein [Hymenobacter properus]|uniref:Outer membrane protein beta-barrel domain-containing protein n=1 Tax=Hymenobacter properus TaxID=2791026 RepID=A0A931BF77_9BACT|nr:hypothetical protein [Hymenobacter properus]MBF9140576.1 hypothetical protein [Hymenobacter properus]MBR7719384.1 hypothetical protein [Microvirga sp. SRT04]
MKRHLLPLVLLLGVAYLPAHRAQAQDKPVLNSAPPGPPPAQPRPVEPTPAPATTPEAPAPAQEPQPEARPTPDAPSGLDFPNRQNTKAGGAEDKPPTKKFIYANLGLGYTSVDGIGNFNASLAPALGFRVTDKLAIGPGLSYSYNNYSLSPESFYRTYGFTYPTPSGTLTASGANSLSSSSLGFKAFAQYIVYKEFFLHAEYEVTNAQLAGYDQYNYLVKLNRTVTSPLAGIGYRSQLGERAAVDILGLYNFGSSAFSLYPGLNLRFCFLYNIGR